MSHFQTAPGGQTSSWFFLLPVELFFANAGLKGKKMVDYQMMENLIHPFGCICV
jgi:hypothetical protein